MTKTITVIAVCVVCCSVGACKSKSADSTAGSTASADTSGTKEPPATTPPQQARPPAAASRAPAGRALALADLKFRTGANLHFTLSKAGSVVKADGSTVGILQPDGKLMRDGKVIARLTARGTIIRGDRTLRHRIGSRGTLKARGGKIFTFMADGSLQGGNPNAPKLIVEGLTARTRRTAMFLMVIMFIAKPATAPKAAPQAKPATNKTNK